MLIGPTRTRCRRWLPGCVSSANTLACKSDAFWYAGTLVAWVLAPWCCTLEIVKRTELHTFKVLPRRWVVERTFGWRNRYRRLSRDYERQAKTGETMVYLAMIRLMVAR